MRNPMALAVSIGVVLLASDVRADPFTVQSDGSVLLNTTMTTSGVFTCKLSRCSGTGTNTVTFINGSERATITFLGISTALAVTNHSEFVNLGSFEATSTPGFTFPERSNKWNPVAHFSLYTTLGDPVDDTVRKGWNFGPGGRERMPRLGGTSDFAFSLSDLESEFGYSAINFHVRRFSLPSSGSVSLDADQGVVPEPGTMILVGSGLVGAVMTRRRASRTKNRATASSC